MKISLIYITRRDMLSSLLDNYRYIFGFNFFSRSLAALMSRQFRMLYRIHNKNITFSRTKQSLSIYKIAIERRRFISR